MPFKRSTLRYGETPEPVTAYQKAAQVWDERIGSARAQAHNWRLMALGSLVLSLLLAGLLLWIGRSASIVPYIVEVNPKGGTRAVDPAAEAYKRKHPAKAAGCDAAQAGCGCTGRRAVCQFHGNSSSMRLAG